MDSLILKRHNSLKKKKKKKTTHIFAPRPLIFELQQEVLKFNDIISPKTDPLTNFLNPENQSFENVSILTVKLIFDIPLLNNLFTSFSQPIYFFN